jgi:hypothetical protein
MDHATGLIIIVTTIITIVFGLCIWFTCAYFCRFENVTFWENVFCKKKNGKKNRNWIFNRAINVYEEI